MKECPKCKKNEIWEFGGIISGTMEGVGIYFKPEHKKLTSFSPRVFSYVCKYCGYIESYVNPKELKKILKE